MDPTAKSESYASPSMFYQFLDGALKGDFEENKSTPAQVGQIVSGVVPVLGQAADLRDTVAAGQKVWQGKEGGWRDLALSLVGWIPLVGDGVKKGAGLARKVEQGVQEYAHTSFLGRWFHKPRVRGSTSLAAGEGYTDRFGNVTYSKKGSPVDQALVYHHEMVHSFLSPKFKVLREFRADLRMNLYERSSFLRYVEEALAESYAQLKVNGLNALPEGLQFPITNGYVELKNVITEGALGTVAVGGALYGVYVVASDDNAG